MKAIRLRIIALLDQHEGRSLYECKGCDICTELERLGKRLDKKAREEDQLKLTLEEYQEYKAQGLIDKEIAHKKGMSRGNLSYLKKKWFEGSDKPVVSAEPIQKVLPLKEDKTAEMRQLISDLSDSNVEKEKQIKELKSTISSLELKLVCNDSTADITSLQEEVAHERKAKEWAQQEYIRVQSELEKKDYQLENLQRWYDNSQKGLERFERENKALRELISLWV